MTTPTNHNPAASPLDPSTDVENPVENLLAHLTTQALTPAKALDFTTEVLTALAEAMPVDARERLSRLSEAITGKGDTEALRYREIASERLEAAKFKNRAGLYQARADALEAMEPDEWRLHVAKREAEQAKRSAEREVIRDGSVVVDITTEVSDTVRVERHELTAAGWHHEADCKTGVTDTVGAEELNAMRAATHHALQDWHDRAHGLISWAGCPHEPCRLLPEAAKTYKVGGARA
ncbi:hypothetical protein HYP71_gp054 [Arthrobacter phage KBurrousTX]|uniref:Uncharacterized protein n=1 Tax=Arthrobacter phage KBurrousTX TaxID=2315608 RepID=A0A386K879_9CAUD|nr:hypothetical protein HYP71_gp054 [Arthrobacter phage KBurrousTX]AYD81548.1 hypothetical protein KBurrousTX_54 [Arthrobacter phage KBurrousTX]